jgi:hypothetical protein
LTLGLGLVEQLAVIPHFDSWSQDKVRRTIGLTPVGVPVVGIPEQTALIRDAAGAWSTSGVGDVHVFVGGHPADFSALG